MKFAMRLLLAMIVLPGLCITGRAVYLHEKAELAGVLIRRAWQQTIESGQTHTPWPWADTHPVARLQIPRIGYDEIVLEGANARNLAFGPARLSNGAAPGEPGNLVVTGHRTSWFRPLRNVRNGDTIRLQWLDGNTRTLKYRMYIVSRIQITNPKHLSLLEPTEEDVLTLVTCYPFGSSPRSPQRFVVRASAERKEESLQLSSPARLLPKVNTRTINGAVVSGHISAGAGVYAGSGVHREPGSPHFVLEPSGGIHYRLSRAGSDWAQLRR